VIDVITVRGTGEVHGSATNMLSFVTRKLDRTRFCYPIELEYPASIGAFNPQGNLVGLSEESSVRIGVMNLASLIRSTPNRVGLLGYSLGSLVVMRFLEAQARGEYSDCEIAFVANIANPRRRQGNSIDGPVPGFGIAGQHDRLPHVPLWEVANPRDGICCCPADSPLRTLADQLSAYTFAVGGGWSADLADRLIRQRWQPVGIDWLRNPVGAWQSYVNAAALMRGYLMDGQHGPVYIRDGYTDRLAALINRGVR
jgi:hypothetical protein